MKKSVSFPATLLSILLISIVVLMVACSKSNSSSKPKISFKSVTTEIPVGGNLNVVINYSDPSNKMSNGTFVAIRNRLNERPLDPSAAPIDTVIGPIPEYDDPGKGEFQFQLPYLTMHENDAENDTVVFKFAAINNAGVSSDTITTPKIVVHYQ